MKKKALAFAGCMALTAPSISSSQALLSDLVGLNLGEISTSSFLNQPFKGEIPFLFSKIKNIQKYKVRLAPVSVFEQIGAEKLPELNDLHFQISTKGKKPVLLIQSQRPIQSPFLNFVLEVEGPNGVIYQDYTVLLDPPSYRDSAIQTDIVKVQKSAPLAIFTNPELAKAVNNTNTASTEPLKTNTETALEYKVISGDSVSVIAKKHKHSGISTSVLAQEIFKRNPKAFIKGDIDRIKAGVVLNMPSSAELNGTAVAHSTEAPTDSTEYVKPEETTTSYTVKSGDNLSKIAKTFAVKDKSFTKMMKTIFTSNPEAFVKGNINQLKLGAELKIPSMQDVITEQPEVIAAKTESVESQAAPVALNELSINTSNKAESVKTTENTVEKTSIASDTKKLGANDYLVKEGDTLTKITQQLGHKEASFTKMMKAIYVENSSAFEKKNITKLIPGSVIHIPALSEVEPAPKANIAATQTPVEPIGQPLASSSSNSANNNFEKRIRELRAQLENKDRLINEKDFELINLKSALIKRKVGEGLYSNTTPSKANQVAEQALLNKTTVTVEKGFNDKLNNFIKAYTDENSARDLGFITLALLLGLALVRYRREIYSYASISYEHPSYYPPANPEKYDLTARNISYQDTLVNSEDFADVIIEDIVTDVEEQENKLNTNTVVDEEVATIGMFSETKNNEDETSKRSEESEEITHCEHLITELFDSLDERAETDGRYGDNDWNSIEKVCDDYIEKIKENETAGTLQEEIASATESDASVTDFEEMMNDLLDSLNEVENSISSNIAENVTSLEAVELPTLVENNDEQKKMSTLSNLYFSNH